MSVLLFFICPPEFNSFLCLRISFFLLFNMHCLGNSGWFVHSSTNALRVLTCKHIPCFDFPHLDSFFSTLPLQPPHCLPDLRKFSPFFKMHIELTRLSLTNPYSLSSSPPILLNSHILYTTIYATLMDLNDIKLLHPSLLWVLVLSSQLDSKDLIVIVYALFSIYIK